MEKLTFFVTGRRIATIERQCKFTTRRRVYNLAKRTNLFFLYEWLYDIYSLGKKYCNAKFRGNMPKLFPMDFFSTPGNILWISFAGSLRRLYRLVLAAFFVLSQQSGVLRQPLAWALHPSRRGRKQGTCVLFSWGDTVTGYTVESWRCFE